MSNPVTEIPFFDKQAVEEKITRIRELNEAVIASAKQAGQVSIDAYEKALASLVAFEKKVASGSQLEWVSAIANTHATFVQDVSSAYISAAREVLK